ncbi:acetyl-CoA C-acetyltransferase, partial [Burkholderia cenocepacia]
MCRAAGANRRRPPTRRATATAIAPVGPTRAVAPCRRHNDELISMQELNMTDVVIVSAARTAVGKFGGSLAKIAAPE